MYTRFNMASNSGPVLSTAIFRFIETCAKVNIVADFVYLHFSNFKLPSCAGLGILSQHRTTMHAKTANFLCCIFFLLGSGQQ
uniref:Uncharacterized protein n=1 Tax=Pyxicephalus adspersus TaxID=30357 RepID=A0AAV3A0V1_PYXAD|nr:TPA: hypothetical protein GDO54_016011 [Pyxicephalus adspersus]